MNLRRRRRSIPVELELLSQASALETESPDDEADDLDGTFIGASEVPISTPIVEDVVEDLPASVGSMLDELTVDPMAIEVSTYPGLVDAPADSDEEHGSELDISIDELTRGHRISDRTFPAEDAVDPEVHAAEIALVQAQANARMAAEVERVRAEAAEQRATELARVEAEAAAQREVAAKMAAEIERVKRRGRPAARGGDGAGRSGSGRAARGRREDGGRTRARACRGSGTTRDGNGARGSRSGRTA